MSANIRKLKPIELCMMLNSTPLGIVISEMQARRHLTLAGYRIGSGKTIDLLAYCAWLLSVKHRLAVRENDTDSDELEREAACDAATVCLDRVNSRKRKSYDHRLIAALIIERSHAQAARSVGISPATLYRRLQNPDFRTALDATRQELVIRAVARIPLHCTEAVNTLAFIQRKGRREADRIRAAALVLDFAVRGLSISEPCFGRPGKRTSVDEIDQLSRLLQQIDASSLPLAKKSSLTVTLSDALRRAREPQFDSERLGDLEAILHTRAENAP